MAAFDEELDRLYALPLDEFTAARNELASRLRREGQSTEADEVKGLAKPTIAAWAVNQLALRERRSIARLLELAERQREALGRGDPAAMRKAAAEERQAVRELVAVARRILRDRGRGGSDAVLEKVATTLRTAAGDAETRGLLERGRLSREVEATGFGALVGLPVRPAPDRRVEARERAKALRAELRELQRRARELEREAERAESAAAAARAAADEARRAVARAEAALFEAGK